jgi:hypothetical protein
LLGRERRKSYSGRTSSIPARPFRAFLAFAFLIVFSLTARGLPRTDEMNCVAALCEHYHKQAALVRLAEQHETLLALGVSRIIGDAAERITKHRSRLFKRDLVLGTVGRCLRTVPLEPRGFGQLSGLMAFGRV